MIARALVFIFLFVLADTAGAEDAVATLGKEFRSAAAKNGIASAGLFLARFGESKPLFQESVGGFDFEKPMRVASAGKWVSAVVALTVVEQGKITLEEPIGKWMARKPLTTGWKGDREKITLAQLMSMTSGLEPNLPCLENSDFKPCLEELAGLPLKGAPGTVFQYGPMSWEVARHVIEIAAGSDWTKIFEANVRAPLKMSEDAKYYGNPLERTGAANPRAAHGLLMRASDYVKFMVMLTSDGSYDGRRVISPNLIREMEKNRSKTGLTGPDSPWHYGLGSWIECEKKGCANPTVHAATGYHGFHAWYDKSKKFYGILATDNGENAGSNSRRTVKQLRSAIAAIVQ